MTSGRTWLGILGMMIIAVALGYRSKLSFIYGIALVTIVSWFRGTAVTYFPSDDAGNARFDYFKKVVDITGLDMIITPFTSDLAGAGVAIVTMLYVDFLDTSGTLLGIATSMGVIDDEGNFPKSTQAYSVDAIATMFGEFVYYDKVITQHCFCCHLIYHAHILLLSLQDPSLVFLQLHPTSRVEPV
jgi:adenine/guanine/hypoxanthine permease